ncbi:hypothetical protein BGZ94_006652 [Podila epigama]|nr:hypothetical protein BGZ94_006652 [Podila epigama]
MKYTIIIAAVVALVQAAPLINLSGQTIPGSYIVVLKDGQSVDKFESKFDDIARRVNGRGRKPTISRKFQNFRSFSATVNDAALKEILASDEVAYVEQDAIVTIQGTQTNPPSYGLTRVSQVNRDLSKPYYYKDAAGEGITAYVIDSGVRTTHTDFGGRVTWGANFISGSPNTDENGHGTHVAGTIGGTQYGVAKKSQAIDAAAARLYANNIPLIAAAGNSPTTNSCELSPAGSANTYTVAASDRNDRVGYLTSFGPCVEIFAPGIDVTSAGFSSDTDVQTMSGTSMAAPHVAGVGALYLSTQSIPTAQGLFDKLTQTASINKISGSLKGSPNRLVYNGGV